jgi:hypothetical protein
MEAEADDSLPKLTQNFGLVDLAIYMLTLETESFSSRARSAQTHIKTVIKTTANILP